MADKKPPEYQFKIDTKERDDGRIQLTITVPAQAMRDVMMSAAYVLAMQNKIDLKEVSKEDIEELVIKTVGEAQFSAFAHQYAMSAAAPHAISQKNLETIMEPELSSSAQIVAGRAFTFVALVTPKPQFELSSYDPVTVKVPPISVTEEEIDEQILLLARQRSEIVPDEDAEVTDGTEMVFSIKTNFADDNEPVEKLTVERRFHQIGKGFLPQGFDEQIMGMRPGDSRDVEFELPLSYNPDGSPGETRAVVATIGLLQIDKTVQPAINDAWVKEFMPELENVDGLREMLRAQGMEFKAMEQENLKFYATAAALAERFKGTIADELYDFTRADMLANLNDQLRRNGMTLEQYAQEMGMEMQQFNMMLMMQVRETLRQSFSLDALARHLKLVLTEEDITDTLSRMAPGNEERARSEFEHSGRMYLLREASMRSKANKWLVETATFEIA